MQGSICIRYQDEIKEQNKTKVPDSMMCEKILAGIIAGFNTPDAEVLQTSTKALRDSLHFAGPIFDRQETVTFFVEKLLAIAQLNNENVQ